MKVRLATPDDAPAIARIHVDSWRVAYRGILSDALLDAQDAEKREMFWRQHLGENPAPRIFLAEENSEIQGFCSLVSSRDADADDYMVVEIAALYVHPRYWRRGIGRALCKASLKAVEAAKCRAITLWVLRANSPAIRFYHAMGFREDGAVKKETTHNVEMLDEIRMRQSLNPAPFVGDHPQPPFTSLESLLAGLLPLAVAWAEEQEKIILQDGVALTRRLLADAARLDVAQPERVRLRVVKEIPQPSHPLLRAASERTGLISSLTAGLTLRHGIYIREDCWGDRLLVVHELVHTTQYERLGGFRQFLNQYLRECLMPPGYPYGPLEQEAVRRSRELCEGCSSTET